MARTGRIGRDGKFRVDGNPTAARAAVYSEVGKKYQPKGKRIDTRIGFAPRVSAGNINMLTPIKKSDMLSGETALKALYRLNAIKMAENRAKLARLEREQMRLKWAEENALEDIKRSARTVQSKIMKRAPLGSKDRPIVL